MRLVKATFPVGVLAVLLWSGILPVATAPNPTVHATLSGFEETPFTLSTSGTGEFRAKISDMAIDYELSYANLEGGAVLAAHIHLGARGTTGGVVAFLCGGGGQDDCPPSAGTVTGTIVAANVVGPATEGIAAGEFNELVRAILNGATYANVHTVARPGGEIRGQITGVVGN